MNKEDIKSTYLSNIFRPDRFKNTIKNCIIKAKILKDRYNYDSIAFSGTSGSAVSYILSYELDITLIHIRKNFNSHYNSGILEGYLRSQRYLIVDDFILTGRTIENIINSINKVCPKAKCIAMMMYSQSFNQINYTSNNSLIPKEGLISYSGKVI